jgi:filamentous hemagglutinin family protein
MVKIMLQTCEKYFFIVVLGIVPAIHAEVVLDGTLGSAGTLLGPDFAIEAHLGQQVGNNLFHSFRRFNLNHNESATFFGPNMIENVISRVTGGEISHFDGKLRSLMPNADIYFLNPAGVMFGPNARFDVPGSLHISTADYLRLGKEGRFDASFPERSLLTIAPPSAFGFLSQSPAGISKQRGFLRVPTGETLSFIGGDLTLQDGQVAIGENSVINSFVGAPSGQVNLVSVASSGEVPVKPETISDIAFEKFGTITITDTTTGINNLDRGIANVDVSGAGGGNVYIRGGKIIFDNGYVYADTLGEEDGQRITVNASDELVLANSSLITTAVFENETFDKTSGDAGDIMVTARQITLTEGSRISSLSRVPKANVGNISVFAQESINMSGRFSVSANENYSSGIFSNTMSTGKGGKIAIVAQTLTVQDDGDIRTDTQGFGDAGDISVQVDTLTLKGGGQI